MIESDIAGLAPLLDGEYVRKRDSLIKSNEAELKSISQPGPSAIPDIQTALSLRAKEPERARKFTDALAGKNIEFLDPRSLAKTPNAKQLAEYLSGFGPAFAPLAEEYLFKYPASFQYHSVGAAALYLKSLDPARAKATASKSFSGFTGNDQAQEKLIEAVSITTAIEATDALWNAYRTATLPQLRYSSRHVLAKFRNVAMKPEIEKVLSSEKTEPENRKKAIEAYVLYFEGDDFERAFGAFKTIKLPATLMGIARHLSPNNEAQAKTLAGLIRDTKEEDVKTELEGALRHFRMLSPDPDPK